MNRNAKDFLHDIIKSLPTALIFSAILLLGLTLVLGFFPLTDTVLTAVNQVIKSVSLILATLLCFRNSGKSVIKGTLLGVLYALLSYLLFSAVGKEVSMDLTSLLDVLFCGLQGLLAGAIAAFIPRRSLTK